TAWRHLETQPLGMETESVAAGVVPSQRVFASRSLNFATAALQSASPKAPILRVADAVGTASVKRTAARRRNARPGSLSINSFQDAQLLDVVQNLTNVPDLDTLPETVTLNETKTP